MRQSGSSYRCDDPTAKVILRVIPLLMVMYTMAYLDRINIGVAALQMNKEIGVTPTQFGLCASLFFVGYLILEIPSNIILHRVGARVWLSRIMVTWGVVTALMSLVRDPGQLIAARVALGIAEAGFFPGMVYLLSIWFPPSLRGRLLLAVGLPWAAVLGAPASTAIMQWSNGIAGLSGWRVMFLAHGLLTIAVGLYAACHLTSSPREAKWLSPEERDEILRLNAPPGDQGVHDAGLLRLALRPTIMLAAVAFACCQIGFSASLIFTPQMVHDLAGLLGVKLTLIQIGFVSALPSVASSIVTWFWLSHSDRHAERRGHALTGLAVAVAGGALLLALHDLASTVLGLSLVLAGAISCSVCLLQAVAEGLAGRAAAVAYAYVNTIGLIATVIGLFVIGRLRDVTGSYRAPTAFLLLCLAVGLVCMLVDILLHRSGRQRRLALRGNSTPAQSHRDRTNP